MLMPVLKTMPSAASRLTRRCTTSSLSSFMLGIPYIRSPPTRSSRSKTVTLWPAWLSWSAQESPAGPEPITATFLPVRISGMRGVTQPSSQPLSMIAHSLFLIVTGGSITPSTQEPSQGAGQTRPVNSGKLLVLCRRSSASFQRPRKIRSFHSGIRLLIGQPLAMPETMWPVWQKGVPQSMQRAPCARRSLSSP